MKHGFAIRQLTLTGPGVPDARLSLQSGLNVISGPSDTGKTFIAQCIDYVLGSSTSPKKIPQAAQYTSILLEIVRRNASRSLVLRRSLNGGDIHITADGDADRVLSAKHQPDNEDTVSHLLLELSGLAGKKVRTNQQGKTRALSFRDIAQLIFVSEESVISADSPVLSGQFTRKTVESRVFGLLLTGTDDSSVVAKDDPKIVKGRQDGKAEMLEELLRRKRDQIAELEVEGSIDAVRDQLERLGAASDEASEQLTVEQESAATLEEKRRDAWTHLRQVESRADVLSELQKRFVLLRDQYSSDLRRLEAITEAGIRLDQMMEERCPVCGAPAEHHEIEHQQEHSAPADVAQACQAEAAKTMKLLEDLETTIASNSDEVEQLSVERSTWQAELEATSTEVKIALQPRLQAAVQRVRDSQAMRDTRRRGLLVLEQAQELEVLLLEASSAPKQEKFDGPSAAVSSGEAEKFSKDVEALLKSWHFPDLDRVTFSEEDKDIVISGRSRGSYGKGVRAITRAAFNLALLRLSIRDETPFPCLALIDSPLVVYREPDTGEGAFPHDVKDAFYRSLAADFMDGQVIIIENDAPPPDVAGSANCIAFTGTEVGRRGFIPTG